MNLGFTFETEESRRFRVGRSRRPPGTFRRYRLDRSERGASTTSRLVRPEEHRGSREGGEMRPNSCYGFLSGRIVDLHVEDYLYGPAGVCLMDVETVEGDGFDFGVNGVAVRVHGLPTGHARKREAVLTLRN